MNFKAISRNVGFALLASAFFMFVSILISIGKGNDSALAALAISFIITFTVGIFPFIFVRKAENISLKDGYMIIVLSWVLSFVFGMLPYVLWGGPFSVANALFESVSGYTTTGATVLANVEALPDSLLFWRSSTHFIGGLGVVVFLLLILPSSNPMRLRLTRMELSSLSREGYKSRANKIVRIFACVYFGLTFVLFLLYWILGMSAFDAINHAFSVVATGGFSTKNISMAAFDSPAINIVTMIFMVLSSIHFGLIFMAIATRSLRPLNNPVLKFYVMSLLGASILSSIFMRADGLEWGDACMSGFFHVISFVSTTGFAISDNNTWPLVVCALVTVMSIACGMAGSTTGGVKSDRVYILLKNIAVQLKKYIHPSSVWNIRVGESVLTQAEVFPHMVYLGLYLLVVGVSIILTIMAGIDFDNAFAASISCMSNVGPAVGDLGTMGNYNGISSLAKIIFVCDMFIGRVEIYPILAVASMCLGRDR